MHDYVAAEVRRRTIEMEASNVLRYNRWIYYVAALIHSMSCAGSIFGWASMSRLLVREGAFASSCSGVAPCPSQTLQLSGVYSAASVLAFCVPAVSGRIQDRFGPRFTIRILTCIFAGGVVSLYCAAKYRLDFLYYVAFCAIGAAAASNLLPLYSVATLFPSNQSLALSVLSGAFDAGTITYFIMGRLVDTGVAFTTVLLAYLAGPVALQLLMAVFLWPDAPFDSFRPTPSTSSGIEQPQAVHSIVLGQQNNEEIDRVQDTVAERPSALSIRKAPSLVDALSMVASNVTPKSSSLGERSGYSRIDLAAAEGPPEGQDGVDEEGVGSSNQVGEGAGGSKSPGYSSPSMRARGVTGKQGSISRKTSEGDVNEEEVVVALDPEITGQPAQQAAAVIHDAVGASPFFPGVDSAALSALPFSSQLRTPLYAGYLVFFVICLVRFNFYISSVGEQLNVMGQNADGSYIQAFGYILPCGFFVNLVIGVILDRYGPVVGTAAVWALAVLVSLLCMIPVLPLQVLTFIVFTVWRGLIFCNMTVLLSALFGFRTLGGLVGVLTAIGGIFALSQNGFLLWALSPSSGPNYNPPNAFLLSLVLLALAFPLWLARKAGHASLWAALAHGGRIPVQIARTGVGTERPRTVGISATSSRKDGATVVQAIHS